MGETGNIWCERFGIVQAAVDYYSRLNYPRLVKCVTENNRDPPEISIHVSRMKDVPEGGENQNGRKSFWSKADLKVKKQG